MTSRPPSQVLHFWGEAGATFPGVDNQEGPGTGESERPPPAATPVSLSQISDGAEGRWEEALSSLGPQVFKNYEFSLLQKPGRASSSGILLPLSYLGKLR